MPGKGKKFNPAPGATLSVSPTTGITVGSFYEIKGDGYPPHMAVDLVYADPLCCNASITGADDDGHISQMNQALSAGSYSVNARVWNGSVWVVVASVSFPVT